MTRQLKQRDIACARCFRLKRKCDHAKPSCGECRRKNAECLPARSRRAGDNITIPLAYLKELERRIAELENTSPVTVDSPNAELCDMGVQTESVVDDDLISTPLWMPWDTPQGRSKWKEILDEESTLLPLELQPDILISRPPSLSSPFTGEFAQFNDVTVEFMQNSSINPLICTEPQWPTELYANVYFSISNREWPFLNEPAWQKWQREEIGPEEWRTFFLQMVYAIGASLCSSMQQDPLHSVRSREMYASAMNYYPHVVAQQSMVLQVQASLLLIVYALHSPSSDEITTSVSSIVPFCTAAMIEIRKHARSNRDGEVTASSGEILTESMFIACFMLNVIITSGWDRPVSEAYRAVQEDMCILGDTIQTPVTINPALGHLFRLRKIQANIKRSQELSRWQFSGGKDASSSSLKSALDIWRKDIPRYGTCDVSSGFQHPNWMVKLYDYSILILMEEKRNFLDHEDTEEIFSAVVEVCLNFRRLQAEGHVMCFTWSAFVYQFRAGITLLYLIWATSPPTDKFGFPQNDTYHSPEAIEACTKSLNCFADRWKDAIPYLKVFGFLKEKTLWSVDTTSFKFSSTLAECESCLELLKRKYLHKAVLGMIEDMMYVGEFVNNFDIEEVAYVTLP